MINPKVSIIVPVYNVENYLENCIESILNQTLQDIELILVNDGSTDGCRKICDEYAKKDNRITVIHKDYGGVSSARNAGLDISKGKYIGFVDSDDYVDLEMYDKLYKLCESNNSDIAVCKLGRVINGKLINNEENLFIKDLNNNEAIEELFKGILYRFSLCNKLFKKSCFKEISFPEGRIHEDLSTTYKLFANADKVTYTNYIGYFYVKRNNSILTKTYNEKRIEAFIGWNEIIEFMDKNYPNLMNQTVLCFGYMVVDHIYYILSQLDDNSNKKKLLKKIRDTIKPNYKRIIFNKETSLKNKLLVQMLNINIDMLIFIFNLKNKNK